VITSCFFFEASAPAARDPPRGGTIRFHHLAAESFTCYEGTWRVSTERGKALVCLSKTVPMSFIFYLLAHPH